jgi:hypothetical protein
MSRPPPPKLDGNGPLVRFVLTPEHVSNIEARCSVALNDRARTDLGECLDYYLNSVVESAAAPTIEAAEKRLDKMRRLAAELCEVTSLESDDPMERALRYRLREDINYSDNIANELRGVLSKFVGAVVKVQDSVVVRRNWPDHDPKRQLANDLDIIWHHRLNQKKLTISGVGQGSLFVRFVLAATASLPSHWPWRPNGMCEPHSLIGFAKAVDRSLNRELPG